ncbi:MAG: TonB-dependent receptor [Sphingomonas sp.]|nr:TonB-dependent receptor [Sphingomonas sp.]
MFGHRYDRAAHWLGATAITTMLCALPAQAQPAQEADYALPAQELARSLREVSVRSGTSVIAPSRLVAGRRAPPLRGRYGARQAVELLLQGSGLRVAFVGDALVISAPVAENGGTPGPPADSAQSQAIVVTGTNLRGAQPTSPVIVITRREIDRTGATSIDQLMRTVPQNTQSGVNKENSNIFRPDQDVTDHGAGLNLRGLGQRATLVLVNGRRLAPSSFGNFVDVSLIPISAVERVEILTDGASAIYGSDAVGGVVNFILRDDFDGLESAVQAGTTTRGGSEQLQLAQALGREWGGGNAMLSYEYRLENEVLAGERDFTIGLRPGTFLLPRERRHSVLGALEQELAPGFRATLSGSYAHRDTERTLFQSISPLPVGVDAQAESFGLSGELSYALGGWLFRLDGNYAVSDTSQRQTQPGGIELVNARDVRNAILETGLRADGSLFDLPAGPVRLALGAQARWEEYRDAFRSSSIAEVVRAGRRDVQSAFAELLVPLFSRLNRRPGLERLQLSLAGRYDRYSRTGSNFDPKLGLLWSPLPGLDLRGSYSSSFRAPLLSEVTGAYTAFYLPAFFLYADPTKAPPGSIALFLQGSNPAVRPETSRNWSVGGDWSPAFVPGLSLRFNYYSIRFSDRIALPITRVTVIGNPAFDSIVDLSPDVAELTALVAGAQTVLDATGPGFSNGGATPSDVDVVLDGRVNNTALTRTRGFDLGLHYAFAAGGSEFWIDANVNHIIAFDDQLTPGSPVIRSVDRPYRPLDWRARGGIGWSRERWAASLFVNHTDSYLDDRAVVPRPVAAHTTFDLSLSWTVPREDDSWLRGTRVALFVENLLDNDPPRLVPDPGSTTGLGYDPVNASARGRFLSLQVRRTW